MPGVFARVVSLCWTLIGGLLIVGAALVTAVRLWLPDVDSQRPLVERWISTLVERPVTVGAIEADWRGWSPRIAATRIAILDAPGGRELLHFDEADIDIATWASIRAARLEPRSLALRGVALTLVRNAAGHLSIEGMPASRFPALQWLLGQGNLSIRNADITVIDEPSHSSYAVSDLAVAVRNVDGHRTVSAYVALPPALGRNATFELGGTVNDDGAWSGTVNARLDGLNGAWLLRQAGLGHAPLPAVDLLVWSRWEDDRLATAQFTLGIESADGGAHLLDTRGRLERRRDEWDLALVDLGFRTADPAGRTGVVRARWWPQGARPGRIALRADALTVGGLRAFAGQAMTLPAGLHAWLDAATPEGTVRTMQALWSPAADGALRYRVDATFDSVANQAAAPLPALRGSRIGLALNAHGGLARAQDGVVTVGPAAGLDDAIEFTAVDGALGWRRADDGALELTAHALSATVADATLGVAGTLRLPTAGRPVADLRGTLATSAAERLQSLLPPHLLPPHGEEWARALFRNGGTVEGEFGLRGPLADFPFRDAGDGQGFDADFRVASTALHASLHWPEIDGLRGRVTVRNEHIRFDVDAGRMLDADVAGAVIEVPDAEIHERMLHIEGIARGPARSAQDIIRASPLKAGHAARLLELEFDGDIELALAMDAALYDNGPHDVRGQVRFTGNRIGARNQGITLDDVDGAINFTHNDWHGDALTATFDGALIDLAVTGGLDDPIYDSEFRLGGRANGALLVHFLERYAPTAHAWLRAHDRLDAFTGSTPWRAVLSIPRGRADVASTQRLQVDSSLEGVAIDLPWPFGKAADATLPLHIDSAIQAHTATATRIDLGQRFSAMLDTARDGEGPASLERAEVIFGSVEPQFRKPDGIAFSGYVPLLPLHEWSALVQRGSRDAGGPDGVQPGAVETLPLALDLQVGDLRMLGRSFADVRVMGTRTPQQWDIAFRGVDADGHVRIPRDGATTALVLDFARLHVPPAPERPANATPAGRGGDLDPRRMPPFTLDCAEFSYGDTMLGRAEMVTRRQDDGLALERLSFTDPDFDITATGTWTVQDGTQRSQFDIEVDSRTLGGLLKRFGYRVANIRHGHTTMAIQANWPGTPAEFTLARMNGSFDLKVENGRFLDIDPGTGRLFGLLSLQALPRRLSLDFEDLFDKGFTFDQIAGRFQLQDGNAYTNSLTLEGPSARINVVGRTGLADKDYDQQVTVTPALSNTLPLAGAFLGPIGWGAGAAYFIGGKMFKELPEKVNQVLSKEYSITGPWDNPVVEKR